MREVCEILEGTASMKRQFLFLIFHSMGTRRHQISSSAVKVGTDQNGEIYFVKKTWISKIDVVSKCKHIDLWNKSVKVDAI